MRRLLGFAVGVISIIGFAAIVEAITITVAEVQNGLAVVQGNKATKSATITWDGLAVTETTKGGAFSFSATVPADCVGTLSDGVSTIDVALLDCPQVSVAPAPVPRTGQTTSYAAGDDGALQKGVLLPSPRFRDNSNGTITDNLTGLVWLKNANCFGLRSWNQALSDANSLASSSCGLTDGSIAGDWRLPNLNEITSLMDRETFEPTLSSNPFTNLQLSFYWSSTTYINRNYAVVAHFADGLTNIRDKAPAGFNCECYVMAVRGGG